MGKQKITRLDLSSMPLLVPAKQEKDSLVIRVMRVIETPPVNAQKVNVIELVVSEHEVNVKYGQYSHKYLSNSGMFKMVSSGEMAEIFENNSLSESLNKMFETLENGILG